jgi:dTMP kinase
LASYLEAQNIPVLLTREPGGSYIAEQIRNIIINNDLDQYTEFFLFYAARRDHILNTIRPAIDAGKVVICDRFFDSTEVYQQDVDINLRRSTKWNSIKVETGSKEWYAMPDITFLLDMPVSEALERLRIRGNLNTFDQRPFEFYDKARGDFQSLWANQDRFAMIDASKDEMAVHQSIIEEYEKRKK